MSSTPFAIAGLVSCWKRSAPSDAPGSSQQQRGAQLLVRHGLGEERPVGHGDVARPDVGPVDRQRHGGVDQLGRAATRARGPAPRRANGRRGGRPEPAGGRARRACWTLDTSRNDRWTIDRPYADSQHRQAVRIDQRVERRRGQLVARRALDRPGGRELLVGAEDLLDPDRDAGADRVAEAAEVAEGVAQAVDVVDAQALDAARADEVEDQRVRQLEDRRVVDPHADQVGDVEEAAVVDPRVRVAPVAPGGTPARPGGGCPGRMGSSRPLARRTTGGSTATSPAASACSSGMSSTGTSNRPSRPGASQSTSNTAANADSRPWVRRSRHHGLSTLAAMWLGTMSSTRPRPLVRQRRRRARRSPRACRAPGRGGSGR